MHRRPRYFPILSLCLAVLLAFPWPLALASAECGPIAVPAASHPRLEIDAISRIRSGHPGARPTLDSATVSATLGGLEDDGDDLDLSTADLSTWETLWVASPTVAAVLSVGSSRSASSPAPPRSHLRC